MRARLILAVALIAVGQGLGLLRGSSFMVDDARWAIAGVILLAAGGAIALSARRSAAKP